METITKHTTQLDGVYTYRSFDEDVERLVEPLTIYTQSFNASLGLGEGLWACFDIPTETVTDGASYGPLTTFLIWLNNRSKKIYLAAIGHDYMYRFQKIDCYHFDKKTRKKGGYIKTLQLTRKQADDFIEDKMRHLGAGLYSRIMVRMGLEIGGRFPWAKYKKFNKTKNANNTK